MITRELSGKNLHWKAHTKVQAAPGWNKVPAALHTMQWCGSQEGM